MQSEKFEIRQFSDFDSNEISILLCLEQIVISRIPGFVFFVLSQKLSLSMSVMFRYPLEIGTPYVTCTQPKKLEVCQLSNFDSNEISICLVQIVISRIRGFIFFILSKKLPLSISVMLRYQLKIGTPFVACTQPKKLEIRQLSNFDSNEISIV